jgi:hypothetical protein
LSLLNTEIATEENKLAMRKLMAILVLASPRMNNAAENQNGRTLSENL